MKRLRKRISGFLLAATVCASTNCMHVFAEEAAFFTTTRVNFRTDATTAAAIIETLDTGSIVTVTQYEKNGWSQVSYNGTNGYIKSEYITSTEGQTAPQTEPAAAFPLGAAELLPWLEAKAIFTTGVDAAVYDIRSGLTYFVRSFSNGLHADVEPITKADTAIMLQTYGGQWSWDPRPVFVTVNGRTLAASINGMPHGGGVNSGNGMAGQVCIHFRESKTHNGNTAFGQAHQDAITEAWNAR